MVILITGKASAGKTTYGERLLNEFQALGIRAVFLDSDAFRQIDANDDFSDDGRYKNLLSLAKTAKFHEDNGAVVIVAAIAPKLELRDMMRSFWKSSRLVYLPGGYLWAGTQYETPSDEEYVVYGNH